MNSLGVQLVTFAVYALAVMRVVRFANYDRLFDPVRIMVGHIWGPDSKAVYFLGCPWCLSIWVAAATVWIPMWFADNKVAQYFGIVLAVSYLVGLVAPLSADDDDIEIEDVEVP